MLPPKLLHMSAEGITPSLTYFYNKCIEKGQWPRDRKKGEWIPVFKKNDPQKEKNYRHITTLLTVDKIFEKILSTQIVNKYDSNLHNRMSGYGKKHSCETILIRLVEYWKKAIDNRDLVCILSTNMSKAFDSLSHPLILKKLEAFGFGDNAMKLMRSFFDNRLNRIRIGSISSSWKRMLRGCPQGSSFGPLLWNLFQNDMAEQVENVDVSMYADDHQLYCMRKDFDVAKHILEEEAERIAEWYRNNYL